MAKKKTPGTARKEKLSRQKTSRHTGDRGQEPGWLKKHLIQLILIGITALAMGPVAFNDFISIDDEEFITGNRLIQNAEVGRAFTQQLYSPHYKPVVYLSWIAEVAIFSNNPYVIHTNNLILHLISTLLVFSCMMRISRFWTITREHDVAIAFFSALLFGIHPLHVESVAWAVERKDMLFGAFYLGGLLSYLKFLQDGKRGFLYLTAGLYLLSMLSKSMGVTLLAITFLMDWAAGRKDWAKCVLEKWPLYLPALIALVMYGFVYHPRKPAGSDLSGFGEGAAMAPENIAGLPGFYQQLLIAGFRYVFFFFHTIVPARLAVIYPRTTLLLWPGQMIHLVWLVIAGIAVLPWLLAKYRGLLIAGLAFFTVGIAPVLIEEGPGTNFASDRYTYIPSIGLFLLLSTFVLHLLKKPLGRFTTGQMTLACMCLVLGIATFFQARKWGDSVVLYDQAIRNYARNAIALHYRGGSLEDTDPERALQDYSASIELNSLRWRPFFARGTLLLKMNRHQEAIEDFTATLERNPNYEKAWVNRGNAYRDLGMNDAALQDYEEALRINPNFDKALNNRGAAYLKKGMYNEALADFNRVLEQDPAYVNGYINRAALYINPAVRQYELAIRDYDSALQLEPNNVQARYFRGVALKALNRDAEALNDLNQAIALNPNSGLYYFTRAQVLRNLGRHAESLEDARKAQALGYQVPAGYLQ